MVELLEVKVKDGLRGLVELLEVNVKVGLQFQIVCHGNPYRHAPVMIP